MAGGHGLEYTDQYERESWYPCSGAGRSAQDYSIVGQAEAQWQTWTKGFERESNALNDC